jgi:hypothetical protein
MGLQFSVAVRNARLDALEAAIGTGAKLLIYTGAPPGILQTEVGSLLATLTLDSDYMNDGASGSKTKKGTWSGTATGDGTAGHFSLRASNGTTRHVEGSCGLSGASPDMVMDNTSILTGQTITVSAFTLTDGNVGV